MKDYQVEYTTENPAYIEARLMCRFVWSFVIFLAVLSFI
ncbi:hypothetical protein [Salmonella phage NINP13076]|uniref:Uncharacterized protein n=1 Tax=Salmonella phage SalP219 TaxID=3158864 RepID=A0AAU7PIY0_9CAUD|nr:hypothetical protein [Salmonella phage NINP13076]